MRQTLVFTAFAGLAVIIACLGVFGLAAHSVEKRTREVGVRKVMGAGDIVRLFLWRFSKPVLLANAIAWPLAWLALRDWLEGFACRVARANPIHALRYE